MAKKNENRVRVTLKCTECDSRNYRVEKSNHNTPSPLVLNKYCPKCQKHTEHKESKDKK